MGNMNSMWGYCLFIILMDVCYDSSETALLTLIFYFLVFQVLKSASSHYSDLPLRVILILESPGSKSLLRSITSLTTPLIVTCSKHLRWNHTEIQIYIS